MFPTLLTVGSLLLADVAQASEAPAPVVPRVDAEAWEHAAFDFERGRSRVHLGTGLAIGGVGVGTIGLGVAAVGLIASFGGNDALGVPLMIGGVAGTVAGGAMVVGSPFVVASGLSLERRSLEALGAHPSNRWGHAALGSTIGGAALGLVIPPIALVGVATGVGFTCAQQGVYTRTFESIRVAPSVGPDGGGLTVSGRF